MPPLVGRIWKEKRLFIQSYKLIKIAYFHHLGRSKGQGLICPQDFPETLFPLLHNDTFDIGTDGIGHSSLSIAKSLRFVSRAHNHN
jgi:hypothetical protein